MKKLGFIGIGNMGMAMVKGIIQSKEVEVSLYDINTELYNQFDKHSNVNGYNTIEEVVNKSEMLFITVKPHLYEKVLAGIKAYLKAEQIIITVAPGYEIAKVSANLGGHMKVMRTMPNTPAMVGMGVTAYTYDPQMFRKEEIEEIQGYFECFGKAYSIDEKLMDAVVPVTGSSPAYGYMFIEAMGDAAVRFGIPRAMAYEMAAQSIKGACEMILQTKEHPGALKDAVTSPGGTTIEAVAKLEETGFRASVIESMKVCYDKTKNMG